MTRSKRYRLQSEIAATVILSIFSARAHAFLTVSSENGFDAGSTGEVCWLGLSANAYTEVLGSLLGDEQPINNPLVSNFTTVGEIELYPTCPEGTTLNVFVPDFGEFGAVTQHNYSFTVNGTLDLREWPTDLIVTDDENAFDAAIHLVFCDVTTTAGFCFPSIHYLTNEADPITFGDVHGETHVNSDFVTMTVIPDILFDFEVEVPVRINQAGIFKVVAGMFWFMTDFASFPQALYMASVAAIPATQQILEFRNEPEILTTSNTAEIVSYALIGLGGCVMLFLMLQLIKHRKDQVMTLTQGKFLVAMCLFGLIAMTGSLFFNPRNDLYCNMLGPMLVIPIHIFYSIILGRLWRINAVISPLLLLTLDKEQSFSTRFVNWLSKMTTCRRQHTLRRTVTDAQLARVIGLWALPQIILQVCNWALNPDEAVVIFNEDMTKGSTVCSGVYNNGIPEVLSAVLLLIQFVAMWVLARRSQDLPSLFNEATVIFDVTLVSVLIMAIATIVIIMVNGPATRPTVPYIIGVMGTLAMILNASIKLVLPKLQMAWRGETVVVTKLIADHQKEQRKKSSIIIYNEDDLPVDPKTIHQSDGDDSSDSSSVVLVHTTEDESIDLSEIFEEDDEHDDDEDFPPRNISRQSIDLEPIAEAFDSINSIAFDLSTVRRNGELPAANSRPHSNSSEFRAQHNLAGTPKRRPTLMASPHSVHNFMRSKRTIVTGVEAPKSRKDMLDIEKEHGGFKSLRTLMSKKKSTGAGLKSMRKGMTAALGSVRDMAADAAMGKPAEKKEGGDPFEIDYAPHVAEKIKITETEPPSRRLLLRMIDVQRLLKQVNTTLLAGSAVSREEWDLIRDATIELGGVFEDDVEFSWDVPPPPGRQDSLDSKPSTPRRRRSSASSNSAARQGRLIVEKWK